jgi:hypothetical protein
MQINSNSRGFAALSKEVACSHHDLETYEVCTADGRWQAKTINIVVGG